MTKKQKALIAVAAAAAVGFTAWAVKVWLNTDVTEEVASTDESSDSEPASE
jgi:hypothetical protein